MNNYLVPRQQQLPEIPVPHGQLVKPLSRMQYVEVVSMIVANIGSAVHSYTVFKLFMTVQQAEQLRLAFQGEMPPTIKASYDGLTETYANLMQQIPQEVSARLLEELRSLPDDVGNWDLFDKLRVLFSG